MALRLAARHVLACPNRTSKDTGPWRIEPWGHKLHSYPHKAKPRVSAEQTKGAALKYYETPGAGAIKCLLILMHLQSEVIFCSIIMEGWKNGC